MPDAKPKRRRRWITRLLGALVLAVVAATMGVFLAIQNLEWLAKWSIHRLFPGVKAEMGSLRVVSTSRLEVRSLALKSSKTGELLLALEDGSAVFSFGGLWRLRLDELKLQKPDLVVSPDLGDALGVKPAAPVAAAKSSGGPGWAIGRLLVNAGRLRITRFGERSPSLDMKVSANLRNFGVGGDAGRVEHAVRLDDIAATDAGGRPFLKLAGADIRFATDELFGRDLVRSVRVEEGDITITPELLEVFTPRQAASTTTAPATSTQADTAAPGWSIGSFDLAGVNMVVTNAPGDVGRVEFRVTAALHDLGTGDATQRVAISRARVFTDSEPTRTLLSADEASATFSVPGIRQGRIEELVLVNPSIDYTLPAPEAPTTPATPASPGQPSQAPKWLIARARCDYGSLRLRDVKGLNISTLFAFDFHNLGTIDPAGDAVQELTIWDTQAGETGTAPFLGIDAAQVRFTTSGILEHQRIEGVKVTGGRLVIGDTFQKLIASGEPAAPSPQPSQTASTPQAGWTIGTLDVSGVRMRLEDKREGVPDVRMTLNTSLRDVATSGVSSQLFDQVQIVELANITLNSPLNPSAKIFTLRSVFVRFTLRELAQKHFKEVILRDPIIYLSRDLFVYMERAGAPATGTNAGSTTSAAAPAGPSWSAESVQVRSGRLVIGSGGSSDVGVPIQFETTLDDVALDNLAKLKVQAALRVPKQTYDNADYQLRVEDIQGDMRFAYPPEKGEKNLVQKLEIRKVRWRQFESEQAWVAVTFDAKGINGEFGGESYSGYVNGGFSFNFRDDSPWQGWVSGTDVDTGALTGVMSPQNFRLTGPVSFSVQVDAFRKEIERMLGTLTISQPGRMHIGKIDDLLASIPATWPAIKQSSTRIALETLRDFDYTKAAGDFWFVESQGVLGLRLTGPLGSRNFEVVLHDGEETKNPWQQGTLGKR